MRGLVAFFDSSLFMFLFSVLWFNPLYKQTPCHSDH